jgi:hypothetical protein
MMLCTATIYDNNGINGNVNSSYCRCRLRTERNADATKVWFYQVHTVRNTLLGNLLLIDDSQDMTPTNNKHIKQDMESQW